MCEIMVRIEIRGLLNETLTTMNSDSYDFRSIPLTFVVIKLVKKSSLYGSQLPLLRTLSGPRVSFFNRVRNNGRLFHSNDYH